MEQLLVHIPLLLSMAAFGCYLAFALRQEKRYRRLGHWLLGIALVLVALELIYRYRFIYASITSVGGFEALLFIAFSVGVLSALGAKLTGVPILSMVAAPIVVVCLGAAAFRVDHHAAPQPEITGVFILGHVVPSLWGYTAFALAFLVGGVYFLQERSLKRHRFGALFEGLPSLVTLEKGMIRLLILGFGLFTLSILIGAVGSHRLGLKAWMADAKVILSTGTWLIYALVLGARMTSLLHGRRVAIASVLGMAMIFLTFVVVEKVCPGWHAYGWKTSSAQEQMSIDSTVEPNPSEPGPHEGPTRGQ